MKVFISWSNSNSMSHKIATILRDWIPKVVQRTRHWHVWGTAPLPVGIMNTEKPTHVWLFPSAGSNEHPETLTLGCSISAT